MQEGYIPTPEALSESFDEVVEKNPDYKPFKDLFELYAVSAANRQLDLTVDILHSIYDHLEKIAEAESDDERESRIDKLSKSMLINVAMLKEQKESMEEESKELMTKMS